MAVCCAKWAGLCHVAWGEVGGALGSARDVGGGGGPRLRGPGLWVQLDGPKLSPRCSTPAASGASPARALPCRRQHVSLRVCAGAAGALGPVGWAAEPGSARARPWRAAARGAVVSARRR